jgi:hypothetical protein
MTDRFLPRNLLKLCADLCISRAREVNRVNAAKFLPQLRQVCGGGRIGGGAEKVAGQEVPGSDGVPDAREKE